MAQVCPERSPGSHACSMSSDRTLAFRRLDRWTTDHRPGPSGRPAPREDRPVSATAGSAAGQHGLADKLGLAPGAVVQEIGYDDDCEVDLRKTIVERTGQELVDEDYDDVVDVVLLWWREDDGDLVDALVDALGPLTDHGVIWLLTPKAARPGHVEPSDVSEAAQMAETQQRIRVS